MLRVERKWNLTKLKPITVHTTACSRSTDSQVAGAGEVTVGKAVPAWARLLERCPGTQQAHSSHLLLPLGPGPGKKGRDNPGPEARRSVTQTAC